MYAKFQAGIWEALSKRYTDVDMALVWRCVAWRSPPPGLESRCCRPERVCFVADAL
jgi:hypothetical protein